jgi:S1-C subfamily serine protease
MSDYLWNNVFPVDLTAAHGSSGSPVFDPAQRGVIGIVVGIIDEHIQVATPASAIRRLLAQPWSRKPWVPIVPDEDF